MLTRNKFRKARITAFFMLLLCCTPLAANSIVVIGDSWARPIGGQLADVVAENGHDETQVWTTNYWNGPEHLDTPSGFATLEWYFTLWPDVSVIYMNVGTNDWMCCWRPRDIGTPEEAAMFAAIPEHMDNIVEHIWSLRPDVRILWTTVDYLRPVPWATPLELNTAIEQVDDLAAEYARDKDPRLTFIDLVGVLQVHFGFDGVQYTQYDPNHVIPPGDPSLPDSSLPSPGAIFPPHDWSHPYPEGYRVLAEFLYEQYFAAELEGQGFVLNAGLNGNWWNGPERNGEGVQLEISEGSDGSQTLVATIYSYDPTGKQIFLIAVGTVIGNNANVDVFITQGGVWGDGFDPSQVNESAWGTGTFTASSCDAVSMRLRPNAEFQGTGYSDLEYGLMRLTTPSISCPLDSTR
jgi:lysophospholipase L1-like esterase